MAHSVSPFFSKMLPLMIIFIAFRLALTNAHGTLGCNYKSIISFGDSIADTGNSLHSSRGPEGNLPYGMTYFHHPTGRFSNGRLIIDFFAEALGLPLVPPYLGGGDFKQGVNFAVGGATALSAASSHGSSTPFFTNASLDVQLKWFEKLLPSLCTSSSECKEFLGRSLFLVGEIGVNDYNYPFLRGRKSVEVIRDMVPEVINAISSAITTLIAHGAVKLVVPGILPIGCSAAYLRTFHSQNKDEYNPRTGCLNWLNEFSQYHNSLLEKELDRLQTLYPNTTIIYADYYHASMLFYRSPDQYGFNGSTLKPCCGGNGKILPNQLCGPGASVCSEPSSYVAWDGIHLTEAAYRRIATGLLQGPYLVPRIMSCKGVKIAPEPFTKCKLNRLS